ncbi:hypothetical protein [Cellulomonas chitinilytica]|nr:hypothetical protein [Cellulomonas chitinilytica]
MDVQRVVVVPGGARVTRVTDAGVVEVPLRVELRLDDLAEALARVLGATGTVADDNAPAPGAGTLVVGSVDVLDDLAGSGADMGWVVGLTLPRLRAVRVTSAFGLAAGVDSDVMHAWADEGGGEGGGGGGGGGDAIYGRTDVRLPRPAVVADDPLDAFGAYARITLPGVTDLPTLLATYLTATP